MSSNFQIICSRQERTHINQVAILYASQIMTLSLALRFALLSGGISEVTQIKVDRMLCCVVLLLSREKELILAGSWSSF